MRGAAEVYSAVFENGRKIRRAEDSNDYDEMKIISGNCMNVIFRIQIQPRHRT